MRNPFRRRNPEEKALSASSDVVSAIRNNGWQAIPLLGSGSRNRILDIFNVAQNANYSWRYANSPAVRTVVDVITRNIGELDLRLYEEDLEQKRTPKPEHPAALSLRYPNERASGDKFLRELVKDFLIHDNAYAVIEEAANQQLTLVHVPSYMVEVQGAGLWRADNYRIWQQGAWTGGGWGGSGNAVDVPPERMLHWHGENPMDPRVGVSRLDTVAAVVAEDAALQAAITELANSGLTEAVWLFRPENAAELTPRTEMLMAEEMGNRLRRRNRTPIVLQEGSEFRSFGVSPQDAQLMEVRRWCIERVASVFGVPLSVVGLAPSSPEGQAEFYNDCLGVYCRDLTRFLNQRLLVEVYDWTDGCFEFNLDEKVMGPDKITMLVSSAGAPIQTRNEARAKLNLPPIDGADEIITPLNVTVGAKPSPQVMPPQDANKPPQDGSYRQDQGPTPVPSGNQGAQKAMQPYDFMADGEQLPQFHPRRSGDRTRQEQAIPQVEKVVKKHLNKIGREYQKSLESRNGHGEHKALDDWARWTANFTADLLRILKKLTHDEANRYMFKLAGGKDFDMNYVQHYLEAKSAGAVDGILTKFRQEISDLGLDTARERIPGHVSGAGGHLGVTTMTFARESAARQAPGFQYRVKSWVADTQRHAEYDGLTVPINDDWPQGFGPGEERNCRCSTSIS